MSPLYLECIELDAAFIKADERTDKEKQAHRKQDERDFYLLFVLIFPLFLVTALVICLMPGNATHEGKSIIAEAIETTRSTIAVVLTN